MHLQAQASVIWSRARDGLWFVPALLVALAVCLSVVFLHLDRTMPAVAWLWFSEAEARAARQILAVTAGSLITVISVAFSVTMIALQQAATQYSPRILRNFTRDRGNQIVLGTYIATFAYSILVLREVRDATDAVAGFVPALSVTMAMVFAMVSLGMLIYFIHHVAQSLQVPFVLQSIRDELQPELESLYPTELGESPSVELPPDEASRRLGLTLLQERPRLYELRSSSEGHLASVDERQIKELSGRGVRFVWIPVQVGSYVHRWQVIARYCCDDERERPDIDACMVASMIFSAQRSMRQDVLFGIEQMVEIAVKALSPGINDPATAKQSLTSIAAVLAQLIRREFPPAARTFEGGEKHCSPGRRSRTMPTPGFRNCDGLREATTASPCTFWISLGS